MTVTFVACGYDGGDCCIESCISGSEYDCGKYNHPPPNSKPFECIDPKHAKSRASVRIKVWDNFISGAFQLSYGGSFLSEYISKY